MDEYKNSLTRQLKFKCRQLKSELDDVQSIYQLAISGFCEHVYLFCNETGKENPLESLLKESDNNRRHSPFPTEFRKIFFNILSQTHPDKTKDTSGVEAYQKAVEAKKDNKIEDLVSIAQDLKINIAHISYSDIRDVERKIHKMELKIESIHKSYPWLWYYSSLPQRDSIVKEFCLIS